MESEPIPPSINLLESMRSVGYSLEAALADIIDNSITADASSVTIDVDVVRGEYVAILDDGKGMDPKTAREALRLAGEADERQSNDLGRFGLGLKTASLSQGRCLSVVTKQGGVITGLRWDIDYVLEVGEWLLLVLDDVELERLPLWNNLQALPSGTLVVWESLDFLLSDSDAPGTFLADRLKAVHENLGLVFHRYLSGKGGKLQICLNGVDVRPIDPFLVSNPGTQRSAPERLSIDGNEVSVQAFTLPHSSRLSTEERKRSDLTTEMRQNQGFYVYRNKRLISHGHWHGLQSMDEATKQTRVQVDVPSSLDKLWQLDIKKSRAEPPPSFKRRLKQLISPILVPGRKVHTYRGRRSTSKTKPLWSVFETREGFGYEINEEHPLIEAVLSSLEPENVASVLRLLQTLAETFPIMDAYARAANNQNVAAPAQDPAVTMKRLREIRDAEILGGSADAIAENLSAVEPFDSVPNLAELVAKIWGE